jgi:serpin B
MQKRKVVISIPKFTMEFEIDLEKKFEKMGMTDAFSGKADFSGMTGKKDLQIDKVIHKAFIEVNESGTEAAAATAVVMIEKSSAVPNKPSLYYFIADHPFLYLIKDNQNGAILFMGKLMLPKS